MKKDFIHYTVLVIIFTYSLNFILNFDKKDYLTDINPKLKLPSEYEWIKRTFPYYQFDEKHYKNEIINFQKNKELNKLQKNQSKSNVINWEFVGPVNIGGRIVDIEFNPKEPNIVYAASATGGVFKSLNSGVDWFPIFDDQANLTIGDIGIDPVNPNILYVGTGEANGGHNNFPGIGIFKSVNSGETWMHIGLDSTASIGRIIIDYKNPQRIFVAAVGSYFTPNQQRGVYLSEDGGTTWNKSLFISDSTGAIDLVIDPINSDIIYSAMWERVRRPVLKNETHLSGPSGGIYKSIDGGKIWKKIGPLNGLPDPEIESIGRIGLTISQSNPSILYAIYNDGTQLYGIYKTTNAGETWTKINDQFSGASNFSWYFGQVRVHPLNPEIVFVLDVPLLKSSNSGTSWDFSYGYSGPAQLHVDHHALAFHPNNPNYILSGNDGGINISQDGGISWSQPVNLPVTQFYEIGLDQTNPERYYGGTQDNNTIRTLTGKNDDWESIYGGDGFYVIVDPNNPNIIYAESQFGDLGKSTNGGTNFISAMNGINSSEPTNWSTPIVMDPNNSDVLYYGTHSLYRTQNGALSWTKVSPKLTDYNLDKRIGTITTIAVASTNSDVIYVGTDDGNVWVTSDYGNSWENISSALPLRWVTRVVVDPNDEKKVYVTFSGLRWADSEAKVFKSENMGKTWQAIINGLPDSPVNAFAVDYINPEVLYLGNDLGTFISFDSGNNWNILGDGLPSVVVNDMKIHLKENYLAIGTHGRGMYKIDLNKIVDFKEDNSPINNQFVLYQNYPNPFNSSTIIKYTIPQSSGILSGVKNLKDFSSQSSPNNGAPQNDNVNVTLKIYDILGREVAILVNEKQSVGDGLGNYEVTWNAANRSSGVYYYQLTAGKFTLTKKLILIQ